MQKYYKMVRFDPKNNVRYSLFADMISKQLSVVYKENEWVYANPVLLKQGLGLCVFDNLEKALSYNNYSEIWECEIEPMTQPSKYRMSTCGLLPSLEDYNVPLSFLLNIPWPNGTVLAKAVKLTRLITDVGRTFLNKETE